MVQGRDVMVEDLFDVIRKVRLLENDPTASINREIEKMYEEPVSLEWVLLNDPRELAEHPLVWCIEPILQSLQKGGGN